MEHVASCKLENPVAVRGEGSVGGEGWRTKLLFLGKCTMQVDSVILNTSELH